MYSPRINPHIDYLNLKHGRWQPPWGDIDSIQTTSFFVLLDDAAVRAAWDIAMLHCAVYKTASTQEEILEALGSDSFDTGLNWRTEVKRTRFDPVYVVR